MNYFYPLLLCLLLILPSCKNEEPPSAELIEEPAETLNATFVRVDDSTEMQLTQQDSLLIEEIRFLEDHCTFIYDSVGYKGNYGIAENKIWIAVEGEFDTLHLTRTSDDRLVGEGFIAGVYLRQGSDALTQTEQKPEMENPETPVVKDEKNNPVNPTENPKQSNATSHPNTAGVFASGGNDKNGNSGDIGHGDTGDAGSGKQTIVTFGDNLSGNTYRVRMSEPYVGDIKSTESAKIYLMLTVDAQGNVVKVENNASKTTTTDQTLIDKIIAKAKKVKYNKEPGATLAKIPLSVNVRLK